MGHIGDHAKVSCYVITQLQSINPNEDYAYLILGNFMTDISQFRDPYANMSAKRQIRLQAYEKIGIPLLGPLAIQLGIVDIKTWLDELLGKTEPNQRYGALAKFFQHLAKFFTHQFFAEDSPTNISIASSLLSNFVPAAEIPSNLKPLSVDDVNLFFSWAFTQYYPHEHLDFPPYIEGPEHRRSALYRQARRGLIGYLEEQVKFIAEELTRLEYTWITKRNLPSTHPERKDIVVTLGHLLHAIEDYYFHSNFVELRQWFKLRRRYPKREPEKNTEDYRFFVRNALVGTRHKFKPYDEYYTMLRRRLARRVRYPIFTKGTEGDLEKSESATTTVYTGGFTSNDMFHSMHGALHGIEEALQKNSYGQKIVNSNLVLLRTFFNAEERRKMAKDEDYKNAMINTHEEQLSTRVYAQEISKLHTLGLITNEGKKALIEAFEIDRKIEEEYKFTPGVGGFLMEFLVLLQKEVDGSYAYTNIFNKKPSSIYDQRTNNGASAETVGTHSLMSKDGSEKEPLREETMALAKFSSSSVATILMNRLKNDPNPQHGLDWAGIIRHFIRFPHAIPGTWEEEVLAKYAKTGKLPSFDEVRDKPSLRMLTLSQQGSPLQQRRHGKTKKRLEERYERLEQRADR